MTYEFAHKEKVSQYLQVTRNALGSVSCTRTGAQFAYPDGLANVAELFFFARDRFSPFDWKVEFGLMSAPVNF